MAFITNDAVLLTSLYYGSPDDGDNYFSKRLGSDAWESASDTDKRKALQQATRAIDRLNFAGCKNIDTQTLQFPRGEDTDIPVDIEYAVYEEALELLNGADPQAEQQNLSVLSNSFASVRTTYDRKSVSENIRAGIMSHIAWSYLVPYLRDAQAVNITRS